MLHDHFDTFSDLFCENLAERYLNDPDHEVISFEDAIKEAGLTIDDLQD